MTTLTTVGVGEVVDCAETTITKLTSNANCEGLSLTLKQQSAEIKCVYIRETKRKYENGELPKAKFRDRIVVEQKTKGQKSCDTVPLSKRMSTLYPYIVGSL